MSARSGIVKAMASKMGQEFDGTGNYVNKLYNNVTNKVTHFDNISQYPYISVTPGPETREYEPSRQTWATLTVYIRIYINSQEDAQGDLESIISDVETFVDNNLRLSYNVTTVNGTESRKTVDNEIVSITTDEGLLDPNALGEVVLEVRYEKQRII